MKFKHKEEVLGRILEHVTFSESGCWESRSVPNSYGYSRLMVDGRYRYVHRLMYMICVGPIPKGQVPDHVICENPPCCNPAHLELVTKAENSRRARGVWLDECQRGHALTGWNAMKRSDGRTSCRTCFNESCRKSHARSRELRRAGGI